MPFHKDNGLKLTDSLHSAAQKTAKQKFQRNNMFYETKISKQKQTKQTSGKFLFRLESSVWFSKHSFVWYKVLCRCRRRHHRLMKT